MDLVATAKMLVKVVAAQHPVTTSLEAAAGLVKSNVSGR